MKPKNLSAANREVPFPSRQTYPKEVQVELGHEDIKLVFDTYGHLFHDDDAKQRRKDRAERLARQTQHAT